MNPTDWIVIFSIIIVCICAYVCILMQYGTMSVFNMQMKHLFGIKEGFEDSFKSDDEYTKQVKLLSDTYSAPANGKRPLAEIAETMPESDRIFNNFYSLGCRFTGYIGPTGKSYFDPDIAVQNAVAAGCRVFVLEIDYMQDCDGDNKYFPRLVCRDIQGKLVVNYPSNRPICNNSMTANIREVCDKIKFYAFGSSCQNASDPVVLVLYFLRQPPGAYNSSTVLDYFSNVAKLIAPLTDHFLQNESTGTYYRQGNEGKLLTNNIKEYNNKVLVFSNANTSGFREIKTYVANEDLDYLTNVRLSFNQTQLGISDKSAGSTFGILETAEDFMIIPTDRADTTVNETKTKWTICLSKDPQQSVPLATYRQITQTYGVHCVPIILHDTTNNAYMFTDQLFQKYSYIPKPEPLRLKKPVVIAPAPANPITDSNQGMLRAPKSN